MAIVAEVNPHVRARSMINLKLENAKPKREEQSTWCRTRRPFARHRSPDRVSRRYKTHRRRKPRQARSNRNLNRPSRAIVPVVRPNQQSNHTRKNSTLLRSNLSFALGTAIAISIGSEMCRTMCPHRCVIDCVWFWMGRTMAGEEINAVRRRALSTPSGEYGSLALSRGSRVRWEIKRGNATWGAKKIISIIIGPKN